MNTLKITSDRKAVLTMKAAENDNRLPLLITFDPETIAKFGSGALVWLDWKRADGSTVFTGPDALAAEIEVLIPDSVLSRAGALTVQARIEDNEATVWHSDPTSITLIDSVGAAEPATPDDREYVEIPAEFTEGNLVSYSEESGRLIDLEVTAADVLAAVEGEAARSVFEEFDPVKIYVTGNKVYYPPTGTSYVMHTASSTAGTLPTDPGYWQIIVQSGDVAAIYDLAGVGRTTETVKRNADDIAAINTTLSNILYNNAGAHNSIYRGKNLGTGVTDAQWATIATGTFVDMYIGDYWVINNITWRIAAFNYYYKTGNTICTTHHVVIVPDASLYGHVMNDTDTTEGAYVNSKMYTVGLEQAKTVIKAAFGESHILNHQRYLHDGAIASGPSTGSWYDSEVELMTEQNVYGCKIMAPMSYGSVLIHNITNDKSQYPLFTLNPFMISNYQYYWLRDIASTTSFAYVGLTGIASHLAASSAIGVRPAFSIKA